MKVTALFFLVMLLAYAAGQWLNKKSLSDDESTAQYSSCKPSDSRCIIRNSSGQYVVWFNGAPSPLVPFDVLLEMKSDSAQPESVEIVFDMPGMDMGFNRYNLIKNKDEWGVKVILPVCSLGKNDWFLKVKMKFRNTVSVTKFDFLQP